MRCMQRDKGLVLVQGQVQVRDNKVLKRVWGSMEAQLASRTRLRPQTIPTDTRSGCRLMCEKHMHMLFAL